MSSAEGLGYADDGEEVFEEEGDYAEEEDGAESDGDEGAAAGASSKKAKAKAIPLAGSLSGSRTMFQSSMGAGGAKVASLRDEDKRKSTKDSSGGSI